MASLQHTRAQSTRREKFERGVSYSTGQKRCSHVNERELIILPIELEDFVAREVRYYN